MNVALVEQKLTETLQELADDEKRYLQRKRELQQRANELCELKHKLISAPREDEITRAESIYRDTGKLLLTGATFVEQDTKTSTQYRDGRFTIDTIYLQDPPRILVKVRMHHKFSVVVHIHNELEAVIKAHGDITCVYPLFINKIRDGDYVWSQMQCIAVHTADGTCHLFCTEKQRKSLPRYLGYVVTSAPAISAFSVDKYCREWIEKRTGTYTKRHMPIVYGSN